MASKGAAGPASAPAAAPAAGKPPLLAAPSSGAAAPGAGMSHDAPHAPPAPSMPTLAVPVRCATHKLLARVGREAITEEVVAELKAWMSSSHPSTIDAGYGGFIDLVSAHVAAATPAPTAPAAAAAAPRAGFLGRFGRRQTTVSAPTPAGPPAEASPEALAAAAAASHLTDAGAGEEAPASGDTVALPLGCPEVRLSTHVLVFGPSAVELPAPPAPAPVPAGKGAGAAATSPTGLAASSSLRKPGGGVAALVHAGMAASPLLSPASGGDSKDSEGSSRAGSSNYDEDRAWEYDPEFDDPEGAALAFAPPLKPCPLHVPLTMTLWVTHGPAAAAAHVSHASRGEGEAGGASSASDAAPGHGAAAGGVAASGGRPLSSIGKSPSLPVVGASTPATAGKPQLVHSASMSSSAGGSAAGGGRDGHSRSDSTATHGPTSREGEEPATVLIRPLQAFVDGDACYIAVEPSTLRLGWGESAPVTVRLFLARPGYRVEGLVLVEVRGGLRSMVLCRALAEASVFGVRWQDVPLTSSGGYEGIPVPLALLRERLLANGGEAMRSEGIFRLAPSTEQVAAIRRELNAGTFAGADSRCDAIAAAHVIKVWLREMPLRLLSAIPTEALMQAGTEGQCLTLIDKFVSPAYQDLLWWLADLLIEVAEREPHNRMTPVSLAVCVGPNLFEVDDRPDANPIQALLTSQKAVNVLHKLLVHRLRDWDAANEAAAAGEGGDGSHTGLADGGSGEGKAGEGKGGDDDDDDCGEGDDVAGELGYGDTQGFVEAAAEAVRLVEPYPSRMSFAVASGRGAIGSGRLGGSGSGFGAEGEGAADEGGEGGGDGAFAGGIGAARSPAMHHRAAYRFGGSVVDADPTTTAALAAFEAALGRHAASASLRVLAPPMLVAQRGVGGSPLLGSAGSGAPPPPPLYALVSNDDGGSGSGSTGVAAPAGSRLGSVGSRSGGGGLPPVQ